MTAQNQDLEKGLGNTLFPLISINTREMFNLITFLLKRNAIFKIVLKTVKKTFIGVAIATV